MTAAKAQKPAKLQVNNSGAWKDVCDFDADDHVAVDRVMEGAGEIGTHSTATVKFRVVSMRDGFAVPLMHWCKADGWQVTK